MPEDWETVALGDLIDVEHGWPFKGKLCAEQLTGEPIVVNIGNFRYEGGFRFESTRTREYRGEYPAEYELNAGDILLIMTCQTAGGEILGVPAKVPADGRLYLHNQRLGKVVVKKPELVDEDFIFWLFRWSEFNRALFASASGTKILHTSPTRIKTFQFDRPSLPEQRRIAAILGALDDKIELNRKMNRTLEDIAQTLFQAWFVDFEGETDLVESEELGMIPRGWGFTTVGEDFKLTMGQSPPGSTYNEEGDGLPFYQGATDFGFRYPGLRVYCSEPKRLAQPDDTLVSVRAPVGRVNMASERCCVGRGVAALRHVSGSVSYTYYVAKQLERKFHKFNAEGTVFGSITKRDFSQLKVIKPPNSWLDRFTETVGPMDERIRVCTMESRTLAQIRDTLLPKLISGEIRVPEAEDLVEEAI